MTAPITIEEARTLRSLGIFVPDDLSDPESAGVFQFRGKGYSTNKDGWRRRIILDFPEVFAHLPGPIDPKFADQADKVTSDPVPDPGYQTLLDEDEEERKVRNRYPGYQYGKR